MITVWYKYLVKACYSAFGMPYIDVSLKLMKDDTVELTLDYNAAFIRYLDKIGYNIYNTADEKVNEYIKSITNNVDNEFKEEDDMI